MKIDNSFEPDQRPCDANSPLFRSDSVLIEKSYGAPTISGVNVGMLDSVYLHKALYFALDNGENKIYKAFGSPHDLQVKMILDLNWYQSNFAA